MNYFKQKIIDYIKEYKIAISEFEKQAGVGNAVVNRILDDTVKNPSIETVLKIANVLDCSLDKLFDRNKYLNFPSENSILVEYDSNLFRSVCFQIIYFLEVHQTKLKDIKVSEIVQAIEIIYNECAERKLTTVDIEFAEQFLKNNLL